MTGALLAALCAPSGLWVATAFATEPAGSLDELLERVQTNWRAEQAANRKRETQFKAARDNQAQLLEEAIAIREKEEARSARLEKSFEEGEIALAEHEELLTSRLGNLGELFGVVRQVAGDTAGLVNASLISSQFPEREDFLSKLGQSKALPEVADLEGLYGALLQEMVESSKVVRYTTSVVAVNGEQQQKEVVRVGAFNVIADGDFLVWSPDTRKLAELGRQPAGKFRATAKDLLELTSGHTAFALDPARGATLQVLIKTPSFSERIQFGGAVGYTIIAIGSITFVIGMMRLVALFLISVRVKAQRRNPGEPGNNPLGRVIEAGRNGQGSDIETLELKMEETILQETSKLERFLWLVKVVSAVTPLMGLLGTVTGMIRTFQVITLFGTGDPKLMAGGISEALVTTMLGLVAAIPLVLLHSWLSSISKGVIDVLQEQGTGIVAAQAEGRGEAK
ncbi:MAG: MotA/TolQ/ExbB proton channel family protein [bacterium]|nr:MotA/TolQ/ExbB proton channel family protein [bacterium]